MKIQIRDNLPKNPSQNLKLKYPGLGSVWLLVSFSEMNLCLWYHNHGHKHIRDLTRMEGDCVHGAFCQGRTMSGFVGSEHSLLRTQVKMERKIYATDTDVLGNSN